MRDITHIAGVQTKGDEVPLQHPDIPGILVIINIARSLGLGAGIIAVADIIKCPVRNTQAAGKAAG